MTTTGNKTRSLRWKGILIAVSVALFSPNGGFSSMTPAKTDPASSGTVESALVLLGGIALWISSVAHTYAFGRRTELFFEGALLLMLVLLPLTGLFAVLARGTPPKQRFTPVFLCMLSIAPVLVLDPAMRTLIGDLRIETRLDEFNPIIRDLKNGTIPAGRDLSPIDIKNLKNIPRTLLHLAASTCGGGTVMAEFYARDAGRYRGFLFDDCHSSLSVTTNPVLATYIRHISGSWYEMFGKTVQ